MLWKYIISIFFYFTNIKWCKHIFLRVQWGTKYIPSHAINNTVSTLMSKSWLPPWQLPIYQTHIIPSKLKPTLLYLHSSSTIFTTTTTTTTISTLLLHNVHYHYINAYMPSPSLCRCMYLVQSMHHSCTHSGGHSRISQCGKQRFPPHQTFLPNHWQYVTHLPVSLAVTIFSLTKSLHSLVFVDSSCMRVSPQQAKCYIKIINLTILLISTLRHQSYFYHHYYGIYSIYSCQQKSCYLREHHDFFTVNWE